MKLRKVDVGTYKGLAYLVQMGTVMVLPIIAGIAGGAWLDERFHTGSRFMIVGAILGTITAFMQLFKIGMKLARVKPPAPPEAPDTLETLEALRQKRDSLRRALEAEIAADEAEAATRAEKAARAIAENAENAKNAENSVDGGKKFDRKLDEK